MTTLFEHHHYRIKCLCETKGCGELFRQHLSPSLAVPKLAKLAHTWRAVCTFFFFLALALKKLTDNGFRGSGFCFLGPVACSSKI